MIVAIIYWIGIIVQFTLHMTRMNTEINKVVVILQG